MFRWFKKKVLCPVKHFKRAGESFDDRMVKIIGFSEYKHIKPEWGYGIYECQECGTRAYMGYGHCMGHITAGIIDNFIAHKIELDELVDELEYRKYKYVFPNKPPEKDQEQ